MNLLSFLEYTLCISVKSKLPVDVIAEGYVCISFCSFPCVVVVVVVIIIIFIITHVPKNIRLLGSCLTGCSELVCKSLDHEHDTGRKSGCTED